MGSVAERNFHVPLPKALHEALRAEAKRSGIPATALARDAIEGFLSRRRRIALYEAIAAYAAERAGTAADLNLELERAATDHLISHD